MSIVVSVCPNPSYGSCPETRANVSLTSGGIASPIMTARHWHKVNPDGLHFTVADTGWGKALWGKIYGQWLCEAGVFTYDFERFHAADILPMFKQYGITTFCAPPTIFRFLVKEELSSYDFSTLEHVTTAPPSSGSLWCRS